MISLIKHPSRKRGVLLALGFSLVVHALGVLFVRYTPILEMAMRFGELEYVEEDYDRGILITFTKKLSYPSGYQGFRPPDKTASLAELKKEEERRKRRDAERRKREEAERLAREREEQEAAAKLAAEEKAKAEQLAQASPTPTPRPDGYGSFGKINTAPIKDQVQRLYDAKKEGKLALPEGRLKVGVTGKVNADGTLADYRVHVSSGIDEIDQAAMAILAAVSASRALGPLHQLNSLTMVLDIDQLAQLTVVGTANTETDAVNISNLAQAALLIARIKKGGDQAAMLMLNNLKVTRNGSSIQAVISMPRQTATDALAKTMDKGPAAAPVPQNEFFLLSQERAGIE